jgi:hypothetical protein
MIHAPEIFLVTPLGNRYLHCFLKRPSMSENTSDPTYTPRVRPYPIIPIKTKANKAHPIFIRRRLPEIADY